MLFVTFDKYFNLTNILIMKRVFFLLAGTLAAFTSCKKDRACTCTSTTSTLTYNYITDTYETVTSTDTYTYIVKKSSQKDAEKVCDNGDYDTSFYYSSTSQQCELD